MREHPWHLRRPSEKHYQWYQNLVDLHALTLSWLSELKIDHPSHFLGPAVSDEVRRAMDGMARAAGEAVSTATQANGLDLLIDDAFPEEFLGKLERTISTLQAWTLRLSLEKAAASERPGLMALLEQSAWKSGRDSAQARWPRVPSAPVAELKALLGMFRHSPFGSHRGNDCFLLHRAVPAELQFELLNCPHVNGDLEAAPVADELCHLRWHWTRGYLYFLNPSVSVLYDRGPRCRERWQLQGGAGHS